jgi:hypothetical protein
MSDHTIVNTRFQKFYQQQEIMAKMSTAIMCTNYMQAAERVPTLHHALRGLIGVEDTYKTYTTGT